MSAENMIRWEQDGDGVVVLTVDDPTQSANTMNELYVSSMGATLDRLEAERDGITGVVLTSARSLGSRDDGTEMISSRSRLDASTSSKPKNRSSSGASASV